MNVSEKKMELIPDKNAATPLYLQLADSIRNRIIDGEYAPGYRFPTEPEFAASLGINHQTLRKSLKILSSQNLIVQQRGKGTFVIYRTEKLYRVALDIGFHYTDPHAVAILAGIQSAFNALRCELIFFSKKEGQDLYRSFKKSGADMLICAALLPEELEQLKRKEFDDVPCVVINARPENVGGRLCVDVQPDPIRPAIEKLAAEGHRKVGYISHAKKTSNMQDRDLSFRENVKRFGMVESPDLFYNGIAGTSSFQMGVNGAEALLSLKDLPTAIICPGRAIATGAWQKIMEMGLRIPQDISVIGYDLPEWVNPKFSTLFHPHYEIAEYAGKQLLSKMNGSPLEERKFEVKLIDRGSISKPRW